MTQNLLKLNNDKTEFILVDTQQQLSKLNNTSLHISTDTIKPTNHVRNLGFIMDSLLKNGSHINKITSSSYCKLHNIARIRPSLDSKTAQLIVQALVLTNIDYCNSLLAGSSQYQLNKLQQIQNMSCWIICNIKKYDHISSAMKNLHWLRIPERIVYQLCLLVYKCWNNLAPQYLSDLLYPQEFNLMTYTTLLQIPVTYFPSFLAHIILFYLFNLYNNFLFTIKHAV